MTSGKGKYTNPANAVAVNQWVHLAAVWDGMTVRLFIDGQRQSASETTIISPAQWSC